MGAIPLLDDPESSSSSDETTELRNTALDGPTYESDYGKEYARIEAMLQNGRGDLRLHAPGYEGWTPLHYAAEHRDSNAMLTALLARGVDVNARARHARARYRSPGTFRDEDTPLHVACTAGRQHSGEAVELLLAKGATWDARDSHGWAPIHQAVHFKSSCLSWDPVLGSCFWRGRSEEGGRLAAIEALLAHPSADVELVCKSKRGRYRRAIHLAARAGFLEAILLLLKHGGDGVARDRSGRSALYHLAQRWNKEGEKYYVRPYWHRRIQHTRKISPDSVHELKGHLACVKALVAALKSSLQEKVQELLPYVQDSSQVAGEIVDFVPRDSCKGTAGDDGVVEQARQLKKRLKGEIPACYPLACQIYDEVLSYYSGPLLGT